MARQLLTKTTAPGGYAAAGVALTETAEDTGNNSMFIAQGNDLLVIHNTGASPYTYTITSAADPYGRTKDITTQSIAAGAIHVFGPIPLAGWVQTDGRIYIAASNAAVKFGIVSM